MASIDPHQFPTARSSGGTGPDEVPSGAAAVFAFLELVAGAFIFGAVDAMANGASWRLYVPLFACGTLFFLGGIKTHWIRSKLTSVDWVIWGLRINRALRVAIAVGLISLLTSGYFAYREASLLWRDLSGRSQKSLKQQVLRPSGTSADSVNSAPTTSPDSLVTSSAGHLDWHNKYNWRSNLRVGMTKAEVRRLFGEPEQVRVSSDLENWDYGTGWITFADGSLYEWSEPY